MKTVNSISGGKTSAYMAVNFPTDYNLFALVTTNDKELIYPDAKLRQVVSDRIGKEFVGTLEDDTIIKTILELEQYMGRKIVWVAGETFEDTILQNGLLPSPMRRYCTQTMKLKPIFEWWQKECDEPIVCNLGFRANETKRKTNTLNRVDVNGYLTFKHVIGKHKNGNNKWKETQWQVPSFPLIDDKPTYKDQIEVFWQGKPVEFAFKNNCVGCFHANPIMLNFMAKKHPKKYEWFEKQESKRKLVWDKFRIDGLTYEKIRKHSFTMDLFEDDFSDCDSGYCGI
jgi:hypothetical protein